MSEPEFSSNMAPLTLEGARYMRNLENLRRLETYLADGVKALHEERFRFDASLAALRSLHREHHQMTTASVDRVNETLREIESLYSGVVKEDLVKLISSGVAANIHADFAPAIREAIIETRSEFIASLKEHATGLYASASILADAAAGKPPVPPSPPAETPTLRKIAAIGKISYIRWHRFATASAPSIVVLTCGTALACFAIYIYHALQ